MINFNYIVGFDLDMYDYISLVAIKQKDFHCALDKSIHKLVEKGMVKYIGKENIIGNARVTKEGTAFLHGVDMAEWKAEFNDLLASLLALYKSYGKEVGNIAKIKRDIAFFKFETGFKDSAIIKAVKEIFKVQDLKYVNKLDTLFWKPTNVFTTSRKLSESKLHQIISNKFGLLVQDVKSNKTNIWLSSVARLDPPKNGKGIYFESYKDDAEHINKCKKIINQKLWVKI